MVHLRAHTCAGGFALIVAAYAMQDSAARKPNRCLCKLLDMNKKHGYDPQPAGEYIGDCGTSTEERDSFCHTCRRTFSSKECSWVYTLGKLFREASNADKQWCRCKQSNGGDDSLDDSSDCPETHNRMHAKCDDIPNYIKLELKAREQVPSVAFPHSTGDNEWPLGWTCKNKNPAPDGSSFALPEAMPEDPNKAK
mmetsp:Transcript_114810/g.325198  ORF Transcript_114810/g.325198 Transcript_114810/m.325198 type:complete len:195 (+) Transcript_114810:73-657(+)